MMKNKVVVLVILLIVSGMVVLGYTYAVFTQQNDALPEVHAQPFWKYQCVDTMKSSRDRAREWINRPSYRADIRRQMDIIASLGANCVSIGTPYDEEFIPYLTSWVDAARDAGLHVWFRGNFAGWEGWFDYKRISDESTQHVAVAQFVRSHPDLFRDGDIFTSAPEAENGGPFQPGNSSQYEQYRNFLIDSYSECRNLFKEIQRDITCNWFSMSGGHAKSIFTKPSVIALDNVVTIDHYTRDSRDMGEYVDYFVKQYKAQVVIGEFGAPIPDLNGSMTEEEQAVFVRHLFEELLQRKDSVAGVNYWTLYEGSTRLLNEDYSERLVAETTRDYFMPGTVVGRVTSVHEKSIAGAYVEVEGKKLGVTTDANGYFSLQLPAGEYALTVSDFNKKVTSERFVLDRNESYRVLLELR